MKIKYPKKYTSSRNDIILKYCKGKKILHIGACDSPYTKDKYNGIGGSLLYKEIDKVCKQQLGIDLDTESIEFLNSKGKEFKNSKIKYMDMNKIKSINYVPDIIIFGEVIEHLMNIEIALSNIKKVMTKKTLLIISTPNCFSFPNFINAFFGFEQMHEDHKVFFSYGYLKNLLNFNDLIEYDFYFTRLNLKSKLNIFGKIEKIITKTMIFFSKGFSDTLCFIVKKK